MNETYQKFSFFKLPLRVFELSERVTALEEGGATVTWANISSKPTTFAPTIGTTATTAKAGNYTPTATEVLTAIQAMNETQKTAVKTALGIA